MQSMAETNNFTLKAHCYIDFDNENKKYILAANKKKQNPGSIELYFRIHLNSSKYIFPCLTTDDLFTKQVTNNG